MSRVIDVHTHMYTHRWLELLRVHGGRDLEVQFPLRGVSYGINGGFYYFRAELRL